MSVETPTRREIMILLGRSQCRSRRAQFHCRRSGSIAVSASGNRHPDRQALVRTISLMGIRPRRPSRKSTTSAISSAPARFICGRYHWFSFGEVEHVLMDAPGRGLRRHHPGGHRPRYQALSHGQRHGAVMMCWLNLAKRAARLSSRHARRGVCPDLWMTCGSGP